MRPIHFSLTPTSPVVTPLRGDTLIGHLFWMLAYRHGEEELERLLKDLPDDPPAASDLFPEGKLPRPQMPLPHSNDEAQEYRKEIKSIHFIDLDEWIGLRAAFSRESLLECLLNVAKAKREKRLAAMTTSQREKPPSEEISELHATINRLTGTTGADVGGLYARVRTHFAHGVKLHGWLHPGALGEDAFGLLEEVGLNGYGADASTGCGTFEALLLDDDANDFFNLPDGDGWVSLSRHLPVPGVEIDGSYWKLETHYGRLGGTFASSDNPFKKPILLMGCGSVWKERPLPTKPPGALLPSVGYRAEKICHSGFTIPLPFKWGDMQ